MKILNVVLWIVFFMWVGLFFGCKDLLEPPEEQQTRVRRPLPCDPSREACPRPQPQPSCDPSREACPRPQPQPSCDPSKGTCPQPQPPCDPSKGDCPQPQPSCDPSKGPCPPATPGNIDPTQYFTITNMLSLGSNEYVVIDDNGRREKAIPNGKCAKVHHSLHGVANVSIRRSGKYLKICRPRGLRNSYPERGTQRYTCNHGRGFEGAVQNYKIESERNVTVDAGTPPETCPVVIQ